MSSTMQQIRRNKKDIVRDQRKTFMSIEIIASISHKVSIVPYIVGAKEVFIFLSYEVPVRKFSKKFLNFFQNFFSILYNIYFSHQDR